MLKKFLIASLFVLPTIFILQRCTSDDKVGNVVRVSLKGEPKTLNPITGTGDSYARQVIQYHIFSTLVETDPYTLKNTPVLAKNLPEIKEITEGENKGGTSYTYEILEDAVWDNGSPITANDFAFTIKAILNPKIENLFSSYISFVKDIVVDPSNPKKFTVISTKTYILAESALNSVMVLPEYIFDTKGIMRNFSVLELSDTKKASELANTDARLGEFAKDFSDGFNREKGKVVGSGPYSLENWETGSKITLVKKPNHWSAKYAGQRAALTAYPDKLEYKMYADPKAAGTDLVAGNLDVMAQIPITDFEKYKKDPEFGKKFNLFTPQTAYIVGVNLNTKKPILKDVKVRQALLHLVNTQEIIKLAQGGMANPLKSPIAPCKEYYAKELPDVTYDLELTKKMLAEAGWKDTNNNGTVDKKIGGKLTEMELSFLLVSRDPAPKIGEFLKNAAKSIGIDLKLDIKEGKLEKEDAKKGNFDLHYVVASQDPSELDDFTQKWGMKSPDNETGFGNIETEKLIQKINGTLDKTERDHLYHDFQRIVSEQVPTIFISNPNERIVISKRFADAKNVAVRPFYYEHLFK